MKRIIRADAILKRLNQRQPGAVLPDGQTVRQATGAATKTDAGAASATFTVVTRAADPNRHGNKVLILPDDRGQGIRTEHFAVNPIVLLEHGLAGRTLPVGMARKSKDAPAEIKLGKSKAVSTVYFDQGNAEAMDIFRMVDEGKLNMASIGFRPLLATALSQKPKRLAEGVEDATKWYGGIDFVEIELWEWSITALGADPNALRQSVETRTAGGEKLSAWTVDWLRQSGFEPTPSKFVNGFELPDTPGGKLCAEFGVTLSGDRAGDYMSRIDFLLNQVETLTAEAVETSKPKSAEEPVDTGVQKNTIRPDGAEIGRLAAAEITKVAKTNTIKQVSTQLKSAVSATINESIKPIAEEQRKITQELDRKLGRIA